MSSKKETPCLEINVPIFLSAILMEKGSELMAVLTIGCLKIYTTLQNWFLKYLFFVTFSSLSSLPKCCSIKLETEVTEEGRQDEQVK
jgi:hypothetical protein